MSLPELSPEEQDRVIRLVALARNNAATAQQLAADAARLLTATEQRWNDYKDRGFFKRCWYKFSGNTAKLAAANSADLTAMQRHAWHYLRMLQEQNLVQADAIAIIRGNLHQLAQAETQTRVLLLEIVEKFDRRLRNVEDSAALTEWVATARVRGYDTLPQSLRLLKVAFDCVDLVREEGVRYEAVQQRQHLEAALDAAGLAPAQSISLADFASRLVDELEAEGPERFEGVIALEADGRRISGDYILENVSGVGYNAVYQVSHGWRESDRVVKHIDDHATASGLRRKAVLSELVQGEVTYTFAELAREIVAGSLLAEQVYRGEHASDVPEPAPTLPEGEKFSIDQLLVSHVRVETHAFGMLGTSPQERAKYLESFAMVLASAGNFTTEQRTYIASVASALGDDNGVERVDALVTKPRDIPVKQVLAALAGPGRSFTWLVDAAFLATLDASSQAKALDAVAKMASALNLKQAEAADFLERARTLAQSSELRELVEAIGSIRPKTQQWKTVLDFRRVSFKGGFNELRKRFLPLTIEGARIGMAITAAHLKTMDCISFGDEGFFQRGALSLFRNGRLSDLKELRQRVEAHVDAQDKPLSELRSILRAFGMKLPSREMSLYEFKIDEDTSVGNEGWYDKTTAAFDLLANYLAAQDNYLQAHENLLDKVEASDWS